MAVPESSKFPIGYFYIISKMNGLALDLRDPTASGLAAKVVMATKKEISPERDIQLWIHQDGFLTNKSTGLVLDINRSPSFIAIFTGESRLYLDGMKDAEGADDQRFGYDEENHYIYRLSKPEEVLDIRHEDKREDARVMIYTRKPVEVALNQQWTIELADPPQKVDSDDEEEDDGKRVRMKAWFGQWKGWGDRKKEMLHEKDLDEAHTKVYTQKKAKLSHELLAGAAAYEAVHLWEKKQEEEGHEVKHKAAKEFVAALAAKELVKLMEERGTKDTDGGKDEDDDGKKKLLKHMAMLAATSYFEQRHGNQKTRK